MSDQEKRAQLTTDNTTGIAHVQLNRPQALNAFDLPMFLALDRISRRLQRDRKVRAVVITAAGDDFSTGLDVKSLMTDPKGLLRLGWKVLPGSPNLAQRMSLGWERINAPVIVATQGRCWGAALQLALGADLRIAGDKSTFAIMEPRWGLVPDMGGSVILPAHVPCDQALRWTYLAEPITARQALQAHLVTEVVRDPQKAAFKLAEQFVERSPDALAATKRLYQSAWKVRHRRQLALEWFFQLRLLLGSNRKVAIGRARKKPTGAFHNRGLW